jgi:hypothetical protein
MDMRSLVPTGIAALLMLMGTCSNSAAALIGSGRLAAIAARQDLRDDVCIAMADGSLSRKARLRLLSRAKDILTPQEYERFRASLDRLPKSADYLSRSRQYDGSMPEGLWNFWKGTVSLVAPDDPRPHYVSGTPSYDLAMPQGVKNFWKGTQSALSLDTLSPPSKPVANYVATRPQPKMPAPYATMQAKMPARPATVQTKKPAPAAAPAYAVTAVRKKPPLKRSAAPSEQTAEQADGPVLPAWAIVSDRMVPAATMR